jgi:hypothetical protein
VTQPAALDPHMKRVVQSLPPAEVSAAAIREATRRLGLLIDLHRIADRLRAMDSKAKPGSP